MTLCCGSHPLGPTVDRHSSVNSGARYAEDYVVTVFGLHLGGRRPIHLAYVTQLALGYLVKLILVTLTQYILWRLAGNDDDESIVLSSVELSVDEEFVRFHLVKVTLFRAIGTSSLRASQSTTS